MKKIVSYYIICILCVLGIFLGTGAVLFHSVPRQKEYKSEDNIQYIAKVEGKSFLIYEGDNQWKESFLTGVNLGAAKPGYYPGDLAITEEDYFEWFQMIGDMNCNVIRVYIPQTPEFYKALYEYNQVADSALYLVQGVYVNEEALEEEPNLLAENSAVKKEFMKDIKDAVDMIHGTATIEEQVGKAYGTYTFDVSQYVIGWILGIEFNAQIVADTNLVNVGQTEYDGAYVYTKDASPMEVFFAEAMDTAITYETSGYQMQRPVAICNWVTTDPLEHPNEPNKETEDAESIDVEHIVAKENFEPGFFASYHVYPYYPESIMYDSKYQVEGSSSYREYLKELNSYHSMPVLVSEFGIPSSRGITHTDADRGFNQGNMTEEEQGEALATLAEDIYVSGCMGGFVFSWQDEWFKRSWNTMDYDDPDRRAYWHDMQTSEQNYGLLAFDPADQLAIDGVSTEWEESDLISQTGGDKLYAKQDSNYLYLLAKVSDFKNASYIIPIDTISEQGNLSYQGQCFSDGAEFVLVLSGENDSKVLVDPYYNLNFKQYGDLLYTNEEMAYYNSKNSGEFIPITQVLDKELLLPETNEVIPFQEYETGTLAYGTTTAGHADYNSNADFYASDNVVEIRLPWLLLNVADPSSKEIVSNLQDNESVCFEKTDGIRLGITSESNRQIVKMGDFDWEGWQETAYNARLKDSYYKVKESFATYRKETVQAAGIMSNYSNRENRISYMKFMKTCMGLPRLIQFMLLCASVILYLAVYLFSMNASGKKKEKKKRAEKEKLQSYIENRVEKRTKISRSYLCSPEGLALLNEGTEALTEKEKKGMETLLWKLGYKEYLEKTLASKDKELVIQSIRLIGSMEYQQYAKDIVACMQEHSEDSEMQYNGFLALSLLNCKEEFVRLCLDETYKKTISFRCLKEIVQVYPGDKKALCISLLGASDHYIQRLAIQLIGENQYADLEEELLSFLGQKDVNVLCDTIRAVGAIKSKKAVPQIIEMTKDQAWEVTNAAYHALAQIDLEKYQHIIKNGLYSKEWWIRYNTATLLATSSELSIIYQEVMNGTDQFAKEILQFASRKEYLQRRVINEDGILAN